MSYFHGTQAYRNELHYRLEAALLREAQKRGDKSCDEWIAAERQVMLDIVNEVRVTAGKDPMTIGDVQRVEQCALGHVDYTRKFALYCAELAEA